MANVVQWNQFSFQLVNEYGTLVKKLVEVRMLNKTNLACTTGAEAGQWENRQIFIEKIVADVAANCPKDEPLAIVSFGADRLLIEYILGKILIENGFRQISFFLIDPTYKFCPQERLPTYDNAKESFEEKIKSAYFDCYKEPLAPKRINCLSRAQNIAKYFPKNANVVVIESLPPYGEPVKEMHKSQVPDKSLEELMLGGHIVPADHANSVALIPKQYVTQLKNSGATLTDSLPVAIFKSSVSQANFIIDWGCKIRPDGRYHLTFSGEEYYFESIGLSGEMQVELAGGERVQVKQWIPTMKKVIEKDLSEQIKTMKAENPEDKLSQENLTTLLKKVSETATRYRSGLSSFFLADYVLDHDEAMAFLSSHASHHYRKEFTLKAGLATPFEIVVKEIV